MTELVVLQGVIIALLGLLVMGLLRSHAEILRRLHELGVGLEDGGPAGAPAPISTPPVLQSAEGGTPAHDLLGQTPAGETAAIGVVGASHNTLLAFLSSGCLTCGDFWRAFAKAGRLDLPADTRVVIVTKSPDAESVSAIEALAPEDVTVLMSTDAWLAYAVPGSPYFVLVDGPAGRVAAEGTGDDWDQVRQLLARAMGEGDPPARRRRGAGHAERPGRSGRDPDRREVVDAELLAAGIGPGHPSLYPGGSEPRPEGVGDTGGAEDPRAH